MENAIWTALWAAVQANWVGVVIATLTAMAITWWAWLISLPGPILILIFLAILALTLIVVNQIIVLVSRGTSPGGRNKRPTPTDSQPITWVDIANSTNAELQQQTLEVVSQLRHFLQQYEEEQHQRETFSLFPKDASDEAKRQLWHQHTQEGLRLSNHFMHAYKKQFVVNTILLRDELRKRLPHVKEAEEEPSLFSWPGMYENPVNFFGIEHIATELERLARMLPIKDRT